MAVGFVSERVPKANSGRSSAGVSWRIYGGTPKIIPSRALSVEFLEEIQTELRVELSVELLKETPRGLLQEFPVEFAEKFLVEFLD